MAGSAAEKQTARRRRPRPSLLPYQPAIHAWADDAGAQDITKVPFLDVEFNIAVVLQPNTIGASFRLRPLAWRFGADGFVAQSVVADAEVVGFQQTTVQALLGEKAGLAVNGTAQLFRGDAEAAAEAAAEIAKEAYTNVAPIPLVVRGPCRPRGGERWVEVVVGSQQKKKTEEIHQRAQPANSCRGLLVLSASRPRSLVTLPPPVAAKKQPSGRLPEELLGVASVTSALPGASQHHPRAHPSLTRPWFRSTCSSASSSPSTGATSQAFCSVQAA